MAGVEGPGFKDVSTAKKVAIGAGVVAGAAAAASLAVAAKNGKTLEVAKDVFKKTAAEGAENLKFADKLKKVVSSLGEGYKKLGSDIGEVAKAGKNKVTDAFNKVFKKGAEKAEDVVENAAQ